MMILKKVKLAATACLTMAVVLGAIAVVAPEAVSQAAAGGTGGYVPEPPPEPYKSVLEEIAAPYIARYGGTVSVHHKIKRCPFTDTLRYVSAQYTITSGGTHYFVYGREESFRRPGVFKVMVLKYDSSGMSLLEYFEVNLPSRK